MGTARIRTAAATKAEGHLIEVEADVALGLPATILTGLPGTMLRETRDRARAAIINSGERWPDCKITVSLNPAVLPGCGSSCDLAIAIAVLAASGALPDPAADTAFLAELGLDGQLRPVSDMLPAALAAAHAGITMMITAAANKAGTALVPGLIMITAEDLDEVTAWLRGFPRPHR